MNVENKKMLKIVVIIAVFIIILLLCWLFFGGKSFAKYQKEVYSNSFAEVAKPIFVVDGASDIKINGIEDTVYQFAIKNYNETEISDVPLNYSIEIMNNSEATLEFELTKNGQTVELSKNKTNLISLSSLTKQTDQYELKIKYHSTPAVASDIQGNVQIKAEAVQARTN